MNIIETHDLTKITGSQTRVDHIHLAVPEGCVYGFLGPNGAGKSTTMKLLLGLLKPTSGSVSLLGKEMTAKNKLALLHQTGSLIESPGYYGNLTAQENLELIARIKNCDPNQIAGLLKLVHLENETQKKVKHFSLGMKQRLGIAMALLGNPKVILLDEPTNGLDPAGIQEIRKLIRDLPRTHHTTVLVSSHLLSEIEQMADTVGILHKGKLLYQGSLEKLRPDGQDLEEVFLQMTGEEIE